MPIEVKQAVKIAKDYIADLYAEESIVDIGLEEVLKDETGGKWLVTVGFYRQDGGDAANKFLKLRTRQYKRVEIDDSPLSTQPGKVLSVQNRLTLAI